MDSLAQARNQILQILLTRSVAASPDQARSPGRGSDLAMHSLVTYHVVALVSYHVVLDLQTKQWHVAFRFRSQRTKTVVTLVAWLSSWCHTPPCLRFSTAYAANFLLLFIFFLPRGIRGCGDRCALPVSEVSLGVDEHDSFRSEVILDVDQCNGRDHSRSELLGIEACLAFHQTRHGGL